MNTNWPTSSLFPNGLASTVVNRLGGSLHPLVFPFDYSKGIALCNPSIYNDQGQLRCIVRNVNYIMHHDENEIFPCWSGPLQYMHPENAVRLATENYLVDLDDDLNITKVRYCNMINTEHRWNFWGLEDARLVRWNEKLYGCGVRRDVTDDGKGRMELSEFDISDDYVASEISRVRIPHCIGDSVDTPFDENNKLDSYCEKNWMPIIDQPYTYLKWVNPLNIVRFDPLSGVTVKLPIEQSYPGYEYLRGGSHVVPIGPYYLTIGHSVALWKPYSGEKQSWYRNHFLLFDRNFNYIKITDGFRFINSEISFTCGACLDNDDNLCISFAEMDNCPYILRVNAFKLIDYILNN